LHAQISAIDAIVIEGRRNVIFCFCITGSLAMGESISKYATNMQFLCSFAVRIDVI
jgi:hypothetical protein